MEIKIKDLRLRTIIGIFDHERDNLQDIVINASIQFDGSRASQSDAIEDTLDYKKLTKSIIARVEGSSFFLLERLVHEILDIICADTLVSSAQVEIDKPGALRFADSVSVNASRNKS